jgi:hypothetical protein
MIVEMCTRVDDLSHTAYDCPCNFLLPVMLGNYLLANRYQPCTGRIPNRTPCKVPLRGGGPGQGETDRGFRGAHLNSLSLFLNTLGLFLRTSMPFIWRILRVFLPASQVLAHFSSASQRVGRRGARENGGQGGRLLEPPWASSVTTFHYSVHSYI